MESRVASRWDTVPGSDAIETAGLNLAPDAMQQLLSIDKADWATDLQQQQEFFATFGKDLPPALHEEHAALRERLGL